MIEGMRICLEIAEQPALRAHISGPHDVPKSKSETDIWDFVRRKARTVYHPTSTCHWPGGRQSIEGAWGREAAHRGRFGDAERGARQHECAYDHDRGTRGGFDPRGRTPFVRAIGFSLTRKFPHRLLRLLGEVVEWPLNHVIAHRRVRVTVT